MAGSRAATIQTPVGATKLTFTRLEGRDAISQCFAFTVSFVSDDFNIDPLKMLGGAVSIEGESGDNKRWFSGLVSEFRLTRIEDRLAYYQAVLRPWFWFLGNTTDCRIFQQMTVVEIVEKIFDKYGSAKFEKRLQKSYPTREYCVQYDESDLDFVQRLLEHEGIFYFFEYAEGEHTLVLVDEMSKLKPAPGYASVPYHFEGQGARRDVEYITEWIPGGVVRPATYTHTDYDFEKPRADLMTKSSKPMSHKEAEGENYRQPGSHLDVGRGDAIALVRREELQAGHKRIRAAGTPRGLFSGCKFSLEEFPRDDQNAEYLVISADYRLFDPQFRAGVETEGETYMVLMELAPTDLPFRPARITRRPVMRGPQTATVVGPSGEEIFTDEYARVKVQFHWDRVGKRDQDSSCFVRVSQTWAGAGWGFIQIPRIGQEVIVDFIEGDPDRPIITGRVYNAEQMPPYGLPGEATKSGWKSNSSKGGGGYNELMFEDKAGSELVNFQAQKDHHLLIKNDREKLVQHDQKDRIDHIAWHSVGVDLHEDVGNNKTVKIGVNQTTDIGANDTETVHVNRTLTVGANEMITVVGASIENIGLAHTQIVGAVQSVTVKGGRVDTVHGTENRYVGGEHASHVTEDRTIRTDAEQLHEVAGSDTWKIGKSQAVEITKNQTLKIGEDQAEEIGGLRQTYINKNDKTIVGEIHVLTVVKDSHVGVGGNYVNHVDGDYGLKVRGTISIGNENGSIVIMNDGNIYIEGKGVFVEASGKINVKASSDITMKGSKINQN